MWLNHCIRFWHQFSRFNYVRIFFVSNQLGYMIKLIFSSKMQQQKISGFYTHKKRVLQSTPDPTLTNVRLILPRLALIIKLNRTQTKPFLYRHHNCYSSHFPLMIPPLLQFTLWKPHDQSIRINLLILYIWFWKSWQR